MPSLPAPIPTQLTPLQPRSKGIAPRESFPLKIKLPPGGPRPVRCFLRGQPRTAGARPRIPGALLPPGAALPPHGPGAAGNHPLALGGSSAALWGQLRQPEGLGALPAHLEGAGPIPALLAAAPRPCRTLPAVIQVPSRSSRMMVKIRELLNLPGATRQMGSVGLKVPGGSCKGKCS